jgi:ATP-dependent Lon protease
MIQDEELINEQLFLQLNQIQQSELIAKHCTSIEERIRDARSKEEAEQIASKACSKFETECASSIVRMMLSQYIQVKVTQYWNKK